jgi:hypothetical protein
MMYPIFIPTIIHSGNCSVDPITFSDVLIALGLVGGVIIIGLIVLAIILEKNI